MPKSVPPTEVAEALIDDPDDIQLMVAQDNIPGFSVDKDIIIYSTAFSTEILVE